MIRHRTAAILFSILLILGLSAMGTGRAYAAQQPARNPLYADQSACQEPAADGENAAEVVEGSPTPLAQPIDGKKRPVAAHALRHCSGGGGRGDRGGHPEESP